MVHYSVGIVHYSAFEQRFFLSSINSADPRRKSFWENWNQQEPLSFKVIIINEMLLKQKSFLLLLELPTLLTHDEGTAVLDHAWKGIRWISQVGQKGRDQLNIN